MELEKTKRFATKTEACEILRISQPTLNRRIKDGILAARHIGRLVRIPMCELERLASAQG